MTSGYRIDKERSVVRLELPDAPDPALIKETIEALLADPALEPGMDLISDTSQRMVASDREVIQAGAILARKLVERLGRFRCAVIVPTDLGYGLTRMIQAFTDELNVDIQAFRSIEEAEAWLERCRATDEASNAT